MPPRVFLAESSTRYDVSAAKPYGEIVHLLKRPMSPFNTTAIVEEFRAALEEHQFDPDVDYVCMTGSSLVVALLLATLSAEYERLHLLMFEATTSAYKDRWLDTELKDEATK
jgi:hypothetical protein